MKLSTYNPSLPHACDEESFNVGYKYGLVNRWKEGVFRVGDFTVFPEGVFTDDGLVLLSQALSQGWNHRNFFYYQRLGVNWFTGPAIDSFIDFIKPKQVSDQVIPERPVRPDNPADVLKKSQVLHGSGATPIESPERLSSIWDVGSSILSILDGIHLEDGSNLTPDIRFAPPGFVLNGSRLSSDISTLGKSGGMTALPLIQCLKQMGNTGFSRKLVDPLLTNAVIENFGKLAAEHGLFIALWFDEYQWPAIARSIDRNMLLRPDFDELCYEAYQYSPGDDVKKRFDLLREHSFWNLVLKSLESQVITQATSDWIDEYHSNRICIICGREFNLFRQKGWIYFGSNGAKNICFNCPIVEYPGTHDIDGRVRDFVQSCGFPPPDGYTPIDIRVTSVMDEKTTVEMIKAWSAMGGIDHVKQTYGVSWFESMVNSGSLPDGTIVTSRGIKSLADDGCVCLSVAERLIDDWLNSNGVAHVREPLYPVHAEYNANGLRRADWLVGDTYVEYFGLHGNQDYDVKTTAKLALAKAEGINILPIYPTDMINLDEVLKDLVNMPKEQENQIERRDPGGNIGRRSNIARRSMDAANYVRRLGSRYETDLQQTSTSTEYTYEFWLKWGTHGTDDGEFLSLGGVAVAPDGSVYVADHDHHRIQKFTSAGVFLTKWGTEGDGKLVYPHSVAVAPDGSVYVLEGRVFSPRVKKFSSAGVFLTEWGARGDGDGEFKSADSVTVAPSGNVYVSEFDNHRVQKFTSEGTFLTKWGTEGTGDGQFITPKGVAVAPDGSVYVADNGNRRVQKFTSEGAFLTKWGTEGTGDGQFISLMGIVAAPDGSVYVAEADTRPKQIEKSNGTSSWVTTKASDNQRIQEFTSEGVFLAKWGTEGEGDGQFRWPWYVAAATDGNIYVADINNHRIQVFKRVSPN